MSKKMKGVAFNPSPHVSYEDVRARFKHQTLLQDYLELQQETKAARNQLVTMKQKKQTLEADVRFLRRRHKFLLKTKSSTSQELKSQYIETMQYSKSKKEKVNPQKSSTLPNLPLIPKLIQRGKMHTKKKNIILGQLPPSVDLGRNVNLRGFNLNQRVLGNNSSPVTEFNQKENGFSGKQALNQARAPIFDLNQISMEEEESFEDHRKEQQNDLMLSICRNVGDGSTNRSGKRKISWQDPVALRSNLHRRPEKFVSFYLSSSRSSDSLNSISDDLEGQTRESSSALSCILIMLAAPAAQETIDWSYYVRPRDPPPTRDPAAMAHVRYLRKGGRKVERRRGGIRTPQHPALGQQE
ncbi:hypothetical protein SSX86_021375 [Deinandra increscens subsp. villosa]|uniref:Uncharacterized protein n=1 Tax=Deinandra increscens subsp. villosa TaxID=3103831 RepID=A0AAP0CWM0_9ASTR